VRYKEGRMLTDHHQQLIRWHKSFRSILNDTINKLSDTLTIEDEHNILERAPEPTVHVNRIKSDPPSLDEVKHALKQLKNGKALGPDEIPPAILSANINTMAELLYKLILRICEKEKLPKQWKYDCL
jgi:hypothetical protein